MMTASADTLHVEIDTPFVAVEPGGPSTTLMVSVHNRSSIVDRFSVDVVGLDPDWFTLPTPVFSLFPGDTEQVELNIQPPPRRAGLRAGAYPFQVRARSASGDASRSVGAEMVIRGAAMFRIELLPQRRVSHGRGRFVVRINNVGLADGRIALDARDVQDACRVHFGRDQSPVVDAGQTLDVPLDVEPRRRPFVGSERPYDFNVTATPERADGVAEPITVSGQLVHQPRLASFSPFWRAARWCLLPLAAVAAFNLVPVQIRCAIPGNGPDLMIVGEGCPRAVAALAAPATVLAAPVAALAAPVVQPAVPAVPAAPAALQTVPLSARVMAAAAQPLVQTASLAPTAAPATVPAGVEPIAAAAGVALSNPADPPPAQLMNAAAQATTALEQATAAPGQATGAPAADKAVPTQPTAQPSPGPQQSTPAVAGAPVAPPAQPQPAAQPQAAAQLQAQPAAQPQAAAQPHAAAQPQEQAAAQLQAQPRTTPAWDVFATACGPTPLKRPTAVALDRQANLFISDTDNNRLVKLSPSGVCLDQWQIARPARFALDNQGATAYLTDANNSHLMKLTLQSRKLETLATAGRQPGQVDRPAGVVVDKDNNLVVADFGNNRVQKLSPQGKPLVQWALKGATDVALEGDGDVYATGAAATGNQTVVLKLTRDGKMSPIFTSPTALDVTSDGKGNVFATTVTDIRKLSDEGQAQTVTLTLPNGPFATPPSIAFNPEGKLFLIATTAGQVLTPH
jgi:hypothetical protein